MKSRSMTKARTNEVAYCGDYCRKCHWYDDALRKPASQLLDLVKNHFEVSLWLKHKGGSPQETIKGLEILSKGACAYNCKGGSGWTDCPVRRCCTEKNLDFCFECEEFPCETNWGEESKHRNVFNTRKLKTLQEMKAAGIEEWIERQWK